MAEQTPYENISKPQLKYGHDLLETFSRRWGVSKLKAAEILNDAKVIKNAYEWVHIHMFLEEYIDKNKSSD